ncbi:dihydroorotate dehydrogenase-like protein [Gluconacetobacter takamatsuzukensis]|uniref:Dihydroorotate dehydrogenase-like protein n=1 Tax=Gluconacetobacter takamatsuzukensis TaxID=1286190 RepID=A0A7W4PP48_9PROT|nr:dihydroorotate dehydrogenase-like protein [Gluconacetobacter takamatsuzukensis]MBB2205297.1 dihydroorotate dehydrogenase-like protein [Gluconacetobacter takamatsuzukensis]
MDLRTTYLGLELKHPIVASASPLTAELDGILRLADAGAAAIVLSSIFEEQIVAEELAEATITDMGTDCQPEAAGYLPPAPGGNVLDGRLETLRRAVERAGVPIIASLNGCSANGWVDFARKLAQAGASAIELNIYRVPADTTESGAWVEESSLEILRRVKAAVHVPVSVKMAPFFSSPGHMAVKFAEAGADGLVLFNRFYGPDVDLTALTARDDLHLSSPYDIRLPLMWVGLLSRQVPISIGASTGVWSGGDVVKYLLAGADAVMTTSALLRNGPGFLATMLADLRGWMERKGHDSVESFKGQLAAGDEPDQAAQFLRAQYRTILTSYDAQAASRL